MKSLKYNLQTLLPQLRPAWNLSARLRITLCTRLALVLLLLTAGSRNASAHGELHLRILEATRRIEAASTNRARLYLERGELHREHGDFEAAEADYSRAAEADPFLASVDFCRGRLLADSGKLRAARDIFTRGLDRSPDNCSGYIGRARVLATLGQLDAAIADYRRALELARDPEPAWFLELAQALHHKNQPSEALGALDSGVAKFGPTLQLQGYALDLELALGNTNAAIARLDTLLANALRKESWFARRADIMLAAGRAAEAQQNLRAAEAALKSLPPRLQQSPSMTNLLARIQSTLARITNSTPPTP